MNSLRLIIPLFLFITFSVKGAPVGLTPEESQGNNGEGSYHGKATWFIPDTGACGESNSENDYIVAMNWAQYGGGGPCYKWVKITNKSNGKSVKAKVTDECPTCGWGSLDLSPITFKQIGDMDTGVLPIDWNWA